MSTLIVLSIDDSTTTYQGIMTDTETTEQVFARMQTKWKALRSISLTDFTELGSYTVNTKAHYSRVLHMSHKSVTNPVRHFDKAWWLSK